jgi:hypothetical protein
MSYSKLAEIAQIESSFDDYASDILDLLEDLLSITKDGDTYEFKTTVNRLVLTNFKGHEETVESYTKSLYRLCRFKALIRYSFAEGASSLCILDVFFNDDFPGEGVTFLTLCQDVLDVVDWIAKEYDYKVNESNAKVLINLFECFSKAFDKLR